MAGRPDDIVACRTRRPLRRFFRDVWGVIHNGSAPSRCGGGADACRENGVAVVLITNAPRRPRCHRWAGRRPKAPGTASSPGRRDAWPGPQVPGRSSISGRSATLSFMKVLTSSRGEFERPASSQPLRGPSRRPRLCRSAAAAARRGHLSSAHPTSWSSAARPSSVRWGAGARLCAARRPYLIAGAHRPIYEAALEAAGEVSAARCPDGCWDRRRRADRREGC